MAWQSPSANADGSNGGNAGGQNSGIGGTQAVGTEYTLQGIFWTDVGGGWGVEVEGVYVGLIEWVCRCHAVLTDGMA